MLPHAHNGPACVEQRPIHLVVALDIATELGCPVLDVVPWHPSVLRAGVPEAAVYEDGDLSTSEDDVRPNSDLPAPYGKVLPEAEPAAVECRSHTDLRLRVLSAIRSPLSRRGVVQRIRIGDDHAGAQAYRPGRRALGTIDQLGPLDVMLVLRQPGFALQSTGVKSRPAAAQRH